ncbi:MAG: vitamin K epoxide reductase family protein [Gemmatimonadaceae bacterium]|nr:vitamin K epoxide reductase family protein [Gemmatimonadaceae bacterium]
MSNDDAPTNPAIFRQAIAVLALVAGLVALYLHLVKIGTFGVPACGPGHGCVQAWYSPWGSFLGLDVALIGAIGYGILSAVAFIGATPTHEDNPAFTTAILVLTVAAIVFTWRLKYGEWAVMKIFCIWCMESFLTIHACLVLAWLDRKRLRRAAA